MPSLFDTPSLDRALALPLDPKLRQLLRRRVDHINALAFDIAETSFYMIVEAGGTDADIAEELGWSLLVNDGRRFGEPGFHAAIEELNDLGGWMEAVCTLSNESVVSIFIQDTDSTDPELSAFCHNYLN
jgi:hypothetical protein